MAFISFDKSEKKRIKVMFYLDVVWVLFNQSYISNKYKISKTESKQEERKSFTIMKKFNVSFFYLLYLFYTECLFHKSNSR